MSNYPIHTVETAPEGAKAALQQLQQTFGIIPNVAGAMAESPTLISAFVPVFRQVHGGTFTEAEIQVLLLSNARTNRSAWPIAFHSALALRAGVSASAVQAIREQRLPEEPRLAALSALARALIEQRGHLAASELHAFIEAGYAQAQVLEAITVVAASTMTNYAANVAKPELESAFQAHAFGEG
jgi:alkylhydroperoxidase family enzyme